MLLKKKRTKHNWNFWFWFSSKTGRFLIINWFFGGVFAETPIFRVFWGCAFFGPSCQKVFWISKPRHRTFWLTIEKFLSWYLSFFVFFSVFFWGFKGQGRWPEGPPHLALNPPSLVWFVFWFPVFVLEGLRVRWAGPKGHLTWPKTLPICFGSFYFPCFCFWKKGIINRVAPHRKKGILVDFSVSPCVSTPPFRVLSLTLFPLFIFHFFVYLFCPVSLLLFHEKNKLKWLYWNVFSSILSVFCFPVLFCHSNPFFVSFFLF